MRNRKTAPAYLKGLPNDRAFYLSRYGSAANAIEALQSVTDWYDIVSVSGNPTATMEVANRTVTITNGTLRSDGIRAGHIFSPDGGATWFNISSVPDNASIELAAPPRALTLTNESFLIGKPKFVRVIADEMADYEAFHFGVFGQTTAFVECVNSCGKILRPNAELNGAEFGTVVKPLYQGVLSMRGFSATQMDFEAGHSAWWSSPALAGATEYPAHFHDYGGYYKFIGVDVYYPSNAIGSANLVNGYMEATQDIALLRVEYGRLTIDGCTLVGKSEQYEGSPISLPTRHFQRLPDLIKNSTLTIDHSRDSPSSAAIILPSYSAGQIERPCVIEDSTIKLIGADNTKLYPVGNFEAGLASDQTIVMNNVTFDDSGIPAGGSIVRPNTYTGTGSLTMNGCDKGGLADGGGGTFSIVTNP